MTATRFESLNDLRVWVGERLGREATKDVVDVVARWIAKDAASPKFGTADWTEYLESLDLDHVVTGLGF